MKKAKIIAILMSFIVMTQYVYVWAEKGELDNWSDDDIFRFDLNDEFKTETSDDKLVYEMNEAEKMAVAFGLMETEETGNFRSDELLNYREYIQAISVFIKTGIEINAKDEAVIYEEALSGIITMLGYDSYAEYKKSDKTDIARELGILTTDVSKDKLITRREFAELLKNAYDINVCKKTVYADGDASFEEGDTLLEENDIKKVQGYVNAVPGLDVFSVVTPKENTIEIDRVEYHIAGMNLTDFLGMKLQGYAKYDEDNEWWNLLFAKTSTKNDRIYGDLKNIDNIDSSGIVYTSAEGKSRRVSLSHMKNIIVNGNHNVGIDDLKYIDFEYKDGMFSISKSSDSEYDTLVFWIFDSYTVTSVDSSDQKIHFMYDAEYQGNPYVKISEDARLDLTLNGQPAELKDLKQGMSISFVQSNNGEYALFKASDKKLTGSVTAIDDNDVYIDDVKYTVADAYVNAAGKKVYKLGDAGMFYVTVFGSICGFEKETNDEIFYAYLKKIFTDDTSDNESVTIRVFSDSGKWEDYRLNEKVKIDGKTVRANSIKEEFTDKAALFEDGMIRIQLNDENKVVMIDTIKDTTYEKDDVKRLRLAIEKLNTPLYFGGGAFLENTVYKFKKTAKIFYIPEDRTQIDDFKILQISGFETNNTTYKYTFDLYTPDEYNLCDLVVCRDYVQQNNSSIYITAARAVLNSDDETELEIEGYVFRYDSSSAKTLRIKADKLEKFKQKGYKFEKNMLVKLKETNGYIDDIVETHECTDADFTVENSTATGLNLGTIKKIDVTEKIILVDVNGEKISYQYLVSTPKKLVKDASNRTVFENIPLGDINPGDRVLMQYGWGFYYSVIVLDK